MTYEPSTLGFGPFFSRQLGPRDGPDPVPARVAAEHRGAYEVWSGAGASPARLAGRLRRELEGEALPGVGDWVVLAGAPRPGEPAVIDRVLGRRTLFTRGAAGRAARVQVVAANVDLVFVVCGLDEDFNVRRLERYLARVGASGAEPVVILSKADLCADVAARVAEVERRLGGVPVLPTSALGGAGLAAVRARVQAGATVALVGSSGAGKSTLVNALLDEERLPTGPVRASDGRGQHVTTHRQLVLLPGGGLLLDTPGMRELALADEDGLDVAFADLTTIAARCRYRDCRHEAEPGCAVRAAVESGALDPGQVEHHQQLAREARAFELRHDPRRRRREARRWNQLADELAWLRRCKGGKE